MSWHWCSRAELQWRSGCTGTGLYLRPATGCSIYDLEAECGIETRQIVIRLIRLMFGVQGYLDDENTAQMSGDAYTQEDQQLMRGMYLRGNSLPDIADALGRTMLGAGWKLLSMQLPVISAELRKEYLDGAG
jgi:hypothetical protein